MRRATTLTRTRPASDARERILNTAYRLFCSRGVRAVGIDSIIEESGVAKMSIYRHFRSKDDLVLAVLDRREALWTQEWLQAEVCQRADTAAERLLAIFDVFDEWFRRRDFEGCFFINTLLEFDDRKHPLHQASRRHLANIRVFLTGLAEEAGIDNAAQFAHQWHILMKGAIVSAAEGDRESARRARETGALLLEQRLAGAPA
jgi:AcrR family transcriptional regulator